MFSFGAARLLDCILFFILFIYVFLRPWGYVVEKSLATRSDKHGTCTISKGKEACSVGSIVVAVRWCYFLAGVFASIWPQAFCATYLDDKPPCGNGKPGSRTSMTFRGGQWCFCY